MPVWRTGGGGTTPSILPAKREKKRQLPDHGGEKKTRRPPELRNAKKKKQKKTSADRRALMGGTRGQSPGPFEKRGKLKKGKSAKQKKNLGGDQKIVPIAPYHQGRGIRGTPTLNKKTQKTGVGLEPVPGPAYCQEPHSKPA